MVVIGSVLLMGIAVLAILSRKEKVPEECNTSKVTVPFFRIAVYLLRLLLSDRGSAEKKERLRSMLFSKNEERFRLLEPAADLRQRVQSHIVKKLGLCFLFLTVGILFSLLIGYRQTQEQLLSPDGALRRREFGKGKYTVQLDAQVGDETYEDVELTIAPRGYTTPEIEAMLPGFRAELEKEFLGKNESADHVSVSPDPVSELRGYPFFVEWSYTDRSVIAPDGKLRGERPPEGTLVMVDAKISYEDYSEIYSFPIMVYPEERNERDAVYKRLWEVLDEKDKDSATNEEFVLPSEIDGLVVKWTEKKTDHTILLMMLVLVMVALIWWGKDKDLDKRIAVRDVQMLEDYPEIASKLSLYVGAGMTLRMAWKKIAEEGRAKKRFIYEEMLLAVYEMESGIGELTAYRHFAKRAKVQRYVKLISLIEQSVKLGARGFLDALRRESEDALEEKKATAKRKGEEAGTKLLAPMMLMLAIVMVVIIVPAFMGI